MAERDICGPKLASPTVVVENGVLQPVGAHVTRTWCMMVHDGQKTYSLLKITWAGEHGEWGKAGVVTSNTYKHIKLQACELSIGLVMRGVSLSYCLNELVVAVIWDWGVHFCVKQGLPDCSDGVGICRDGFDGFNGWRDSKQGIVFMILVDLLCPCTARAQVWRIRRYAPAYSPTVLSAYIHKNTYPVLCATMCADRLQSRTEISTIKCQT